MKETLFLFIVLGFYLSEKGVGKSRLQIERYPPGGLFFLNRVLSLFLGTIVFFLLEMFLNQLGASFVDYKLHILLGFIAAWLFCAVLDTEVFFAIGSYFIYFLLQAEKLTGSLFIERALLYAGAIIFFEAVFIGFKYRLYFVPLNATVKGRAQYLLFFLVVAICLSALKLITV